MEKLTEEVLKARAKALYFDKNPKIDKIFVDEFGRFSYNKQNLLEVNKLTDAKVFEIKNKGLKADPDLVKKIKEDSKPPEKKK